MNQFENIKYHWEAHKQAMEDAKVQVNKMVGCYTGKNLEAMKALSSKLDHMIYLGQPQTIIDFLTRISKGIMFTYGVPHSVWNTIDHRENVVKLKGVPYNPKNYVEIKKGHFRWNQDKIYRLDRNDCDYIKEFFFGDFKGKDIFPFNVQHIRTAGYEGCTAIELLTDNNNEYRIVVYDDGKVSANWIIKEPPTAIKNWALNYIGFEK